MSNEFKDWLIDASNDDVRTAYYRCLDNKWYREAGLYEQALIDRGIYLEDDK